MKHEFTGPSNSERHNSVVRADRLTRRHQVQVLAGPPTLIRFNDLCRPDQGIVHTPESIGPDRGADTPHRIHGVMALRPGDRNPLVRGIGGWTVCEDGAHDLAQHIVTWLD